MRLQDIVDRIFKAQNDMGYIEKINSSIEDRMDYFRDIALALIKEVSETLDETPWKPWRNLYDQPLDKDKAALEVCDIIVFAAVMYIILEPSMPLEDSMEITLAKNEKRIKLEDYGRKEKS